MTDLNEYYTVVKLLHCPLCGEKKNFKFISFSDDKLITKKYTPLVKDFISTDSTSLYRCQNCDIRFYNPQLIGSQKLYLELKKFDWYYLDSKPEYDIAANFIEKNASVLEFGAGMGAFRSYLSDKNFYIGTELSPNEAQRQNNVVSESEIIGKLYDVVISFQFMEHVPNILEFLNKKWAYVRPGGKMLVSVPADNSFLRFAYESALNHPPHHLSLWTDESLTYVSKLLANVRDIKIIHEPVAPFHRHWADSEIVFRVLRFFLRIQPRMLYENEVTRRLWRISLIVGRITPIKLAKRGHTVVVVYTKENP